MKILTTADVAKLLRIDKRTIQKQAQKPYTEPVKETIKPQPVAIQSKTQVSSQKTPVKQISKEERLKAYEVKAFKKLQSNFHPISNSQSRWAAEGDVLIYPNGDASLNQNRLSEDDEVMSLMSRTISNSKPFDKFNSSEIGGYMISIPIVWDGTTLKTTDTLILEGLKEEQ